MTVQAETSGHNRDSFPSWSIITYEFAATAERPAVKVFWYDGGKQPKKELFEGLQGRGGCLVIGDKGKMVSAGGGPEGFRLSKISSSPRSRSPYRPAISRNSSAPFAAENRPGRISPSMPGP